MFLVSSNGRGHVGIEPNTHSKGPGNQPSRIRTLPVRPAAPSVIRAFRCPSSDVYTGISWPFSLRRLGLIRDLRQKRRHYPHRLDRSQSFDVSDLSSSLWSLQLQVEVADMPESSFSFMMTKQNGHRMKLFPQP